jgi:hypothetical protein
MTKLTEQNVGAILSSNLGQFTLPYTVAFGVGSSRIEQPISVQKIGFAFHISLSYWQSREKSKLMRLHTQGKRVHARCDIRVGRAIGNWIVTKVPM